MNTTELNAERLMSELRRIVANSEDLLQATKDNVGDQAHEVRERLAQTLESAKRTCRHLEARALESAKVADQTIRDHPYQSIGVAFGIGLLIGVLVAKK